MSKAGLSLILFWLCSLITSDCWKICPLIQYRNHKDPIVQTLGSVLLASLSDLPIFEHPLALECINGVVRNPSLCELQAVFKHFQEVRSSHKTLDIHLRQFQRDIMDTIRSVQRNFGIMLHLGGQPILLRVVPSSKFHETHFKIGSLNIWPYMYESGQSLDGADVDILDIITTKYGITFDLYRAKTITRVSYPNGTSSGYIADIVDNKHHFGVGQLTVTSARAEEISYGRDMFLREMGFASPPAGKAAKPDTLLRPFDIWTWFGTILSFLSILGFLVLVVKCSDHIDVETGFVSYIVAIGPLLQESQAPRMFRDHRYFSRRFIIGMWLLMGYLLSIFYETNLLATLTFANYKKPIDTPEEIIASKLPVFVQGGTAFENGLKYSPIKIFQQLYQKASVDRNGLYSTSTEDEQEHRDLLVLERKAFATTTKIRADTNSKLRYHSVSYFIGTSAWVFPKESHLKEILDMDILRLMESGMLTMLSNKHVTKKLLEQNLLTGKDDFVMVEYGQISLEQFQPIFLAWGIGIVASCTITVMEILWAKLALKKP